MKIKRAKLILVKVLGTTLRRPERNVSKHSMLKIQSSTDIVLAKGTRIYSTRHCLFSNFTRALTFLNL